MASSEDALEETGILGVFWFDEDGRFKNIIRIKDAELEREGTYSIEGEQVLVSLPEFKIDNYDDSMIKSLSGKVVTDCPIVIDGDKLTAEGFGSDGSDTTATRITDAQYQEYVDRCIAMGPKRVAVGESVTTDVATFTVDSLAYVNEINPPDTSGFYQYYADEDGKTYLLAKITYTNNGTEYAAPGGSTSASFNIGGNKYSAEIEVAAGSDMGAHYSVEAKETAQLYIWCSVPDSVKDTAPAELTWLIPTEQGDMNNYFMNSHPHDTLIITA